MKPVNSVFFIILVILLGRFGCRNQSIIGKDTNLFENDIENPSN